MTPEERLVQIVHLYQQQYITLAKAKNLANRHVGALALRVNWWNVKREARSDRALQPPETSLAEADQR